MESILIPKTVKPSYTYTCGWCHRPFTTTKRTTVETNRYCSFSHLMSALHGREMEVDKRTLKDVELPETLRVQTIPKYVLGIIKNGAYTYKGSEWGYGRDYYEIRDKAIMSLGFLACGRVNEVLRVKKNQVDLDGNPECVVVRNFYVSKRKKVTLEREGPTHVEIPAPKNKDALLYPFTEYVLAYYEICETERLFPIGEGRAWQIVKSSTDLWPHWFRSLGLTYFANMILNPFALAKIYGVKNVNTILHYFKGQWAQYMEVYTKSDKFV